MKGLEAGRRVVVPGLLNRVGAVYGQIPRSLLLRLSSLVAPAG